MIKKPNQTLEEISNLLDKVDLNKEQIIVSPNEERLLIASKSKKHDPLKLLNFISEQKAYNWNLLSKENREKLLTLISKNIELHVSELADKFIDLKQLMNKFTPTKEED